MLAVFDHNEQVLFFSFNGASLYVNLKDTQWPRARSGQLETSGPREEAFWRGCTVENFFGRHSAWLQAIQDSVENIMEKREEIADSG